MAASDPANPYGSLLPWPGENHGMSRAAGGSVVLELTESQPVALDPQLDLLTAIAAQFHARRNPVLAMRENAHWLAEGARAGNVDGVVLWLIEEDEALPWEIARQVRNLPPDLPVLLLSRQAWEVDADAWTKVRDFVAGLETKR